MKKENRKESKGALPRSFGRLRKPLLKLLFNQKINDFKSANREKRETKKTTGGRKPQSFDRLSKPLPNKTA
jgi:hypothetical protein